MGSFEIVTVSAVVVLVVGHSSVRLSGEAATLKPLDSFGNNTHGLGEGRADSNVIEVGREQL